MKLNDQIIQSAETRDKSYKLFDGQGLYIEISSKGSKFWRLKYRFEGKEKRISLGAYPEVSIEDAREHMRLCKEQLKGGTDPSQARKDSNQSITVPPKVDSTRDEVMPIEPSGSNEISEQQKAISEDPTTTQPTGSDEGAFSGDLGAFNDEEDDHPQDGSENVAEEDYGPPQTDQTDTSSSDAAILQVLNELKGELEALRQENRLLKDQINARDNLSEPYQPSAAEFEVLDEIQE